MSEKKKEDMIKEAVEEAKASGEVVDEEELKADPIIEEAKQEKENSKKKKSKKQDKKDEKIEELTDKLTRQMAEFENFRKRTDKEKSKMYEIGSFKELLELSD